MIKKPNDVVITGVGIVTCHGTGKEAHVALLSSAVAPPPVLETEKFKPYPVHRLPEIDWSQQIAKRGDQRQMENWQRLGVFTAGLALDDAGFKDDAEALAPQRPTRMPHQRRQQRARAAHQHESRRKVQCRHQAAATAAID